MGDNVGKGTGEARGVCAHPPTSLNTCPGARASEGGSWAQHPSAGQPDTLLGSCPANETAASSLLTAAPLDVLVALRCLFPLPGPRVALAKIRLSKGSGEGPWLPPLLPPASSGCAACWVQEAGVHSWFLVPGLLVCSQPAAAPAASFLGVRSQCRVREHNDKNNSTQPQGCLRCTGAARRPAHLHSPTSQAGHEPVRGTASACWHTVAAWALSDCIGQRSLCCLQCSSRSGSMPVADPLPAHTRLGLVVPPICHLGGQGLRAFEVGRGGCLQGAGCSERLAVRSGRWPWVWEAHGGTVKVQRGNEKCLKGKLQKRLYISPSLQILRE